jgi:hypothetical protein
MNGRRLLRALTPEIVQRRRAQLASRAAARWLRRTANGSGTIVAGPWTEGVGFELLYWIPLLSWLTEVAGVERRRLVAVSRDGADPWYADVARRYVDLQNSAEDDPKAVVEAIANGSGASDVTLLPPSLLPQLFAPRWSWGAGPGVVRAFTLHRQLPDDHQPSPAGKSPYVVLDASFGTAFPDTAENRGFLDRMIGDLTSRGRVVALPGPDGPAFVDDRVEMLSGAIPARERLALRTRVVRHADLFVSSYDGFSYVGPYVGTPTLAFYSDASAFIAVHLDEIDRVSRSFAEGRPGLYRARHIGHLVPATPA